MHGFIIGLVLLGSLSVVSDGIAQPAAPPPVENVTVNGRRVPDAEIHAFVTSRAAPTFKLGKVARWEKGICPTVMSMLFFEELSPVPTVLSSARVSMKLAILCFGVDIEDVR